MVENEQTRKNKQASRTLTELPTCIQRHMLKSQIV